jgi:hypothetical protein
MTLLCTYIKMLMYASITRSWMFRNAITYFCSFITRNDKASKDMYGIQIRQNHEMIENIQS